VFDKGEQTRRGVSLENLPLNDSPGGKERAGNNFPEFLRQNNPDQLPDRRIARPQLFVEPALQLPPLHFFSLGSPRPFFPVVKSRINPESAVTPTGSLFSILIALSTKLASFVSFSGWFKSR